MDVGTIVARSMRRYRDRIALVGPDGTKTYGEVGARIFQLARALRALGLKSEDRVLDLQSNQNTYIETDLGISSAGLCRVALNYRLHPNDWVRITKDCGAKVLILDAKFWDDAAPVRELVEHIIVINGDAPGALPYEKFLAKESTEPLRIDISPDTLVSLNYSSGTTGNPKGAIRTHRNRLASLGNIVTDIFGRTPNENDIWVHAGPVTHTSGLFVLPFFTFGARQVIHAKYEPELLLEEIESRGANATALVPTMVARLLTLDGITPERFKNLKMLGYAGAPMPPEQIRECFENITTHMIQYYGLVEAIPPVTVLSEADHRLGLEKTPEVLTSAGNPCTTVEIKIVDDDGKEVANGEIGEVITRGDLVMRGYYGAAGSDPNVTKVVRDGWLHTGDLGRLDSDNRLYLVDRKGDMIISGGYNIYPREIEDVIAEVAEINEVAVLGAPDKEWGQRVTAFVSLKPNSALDEESVVTKILEHCKSKMASYKKPKDVFVVKEFPLNSTGKISKKILKLQLEKDRGA